MRSFKLFKKNTLITNLEFFDKIRITILNKIKNIEEWKMEMHKGFRMKPHSNYNKLVVYY